MQVNKMKVLVTGGAGFIGPHIAERLIEMGWDVNGIDLKDCNNKDVNFIKENILDKSKVEKAVKGCDYVFHEAAVTAPPEFEIYPEKGYKVNVLGTFNILSGASKAGVKRVIFASSSSVYGNLNKKAKEEMATFNHVNLYPITKMINEVTARYFHNRGELETIALRYFNTYGLRENTKGAYSSIMHKFISDIKSWRRPVIYGDGMQRRDFIYVEDVVDANIQAIKNGRSGEVYNVGTGNALTFNEIEKIIAKEMDFEKDPVYIKNPLKHYQTFTQADTTKAKKELKFVARFDIKKGIREMLDKAAKA